MGPISVVEARARAVGESHRTPPREPDANPTFAKAGPGPAGATIPAAVTESADAGRASVRDESKALGRIPTSANANADRRRRRVDR
ncbi:hypothetical protein ACFQHN_02345 [Natrialbaceae archaeon GCM10025896]